MTNESALLGLLAELYRDRAQLQHENARLQAELARTHSPATTGPTDEDPPCPPR